MQRVWENTTKQFVGDYVKKTIWIINGYGGVGKDTFVDFVSKYLKVMNVSSIDPIKEVAKQLGWNGKKDEKSRKFLSDLKDLSIEYNNFPFNYIGQQIINFYSSDSEIMFIHIREPEEIEKVVSAFRCNTLLIRNMDIPIFQNHADDNVLIYNYDEVIMNTGTLDKLEEQAEEFVNHIKQATA